MIFRKKKPATPIEKIQQRASEVAGEVVELVTDAAERVSDAAERVTDNWRHKPSRIEGFKATLMHTPDKLGDLRESAGHLKDNAGDAAARVRDAVAHRASVSDTIVKSAAKNATKTAAKTATAAIHAAGQRVLPGRAPEPIIVNEDRGSKILWFALGLLAGAMLGLLLAPTSGRRSRALLKDKAAKGGQKAAGLGGTATGTVADLGRRAKGAAHELTSRIGSDDADDTVIADRVRTALGHSSATHGLERLNVTCVDGVVTLHGPIVDEALQATIEGVVRGVKGVREVQSALLLEDAPEDSATFVG